MRLVSFTHAGGPGFGVITPDGVADLSAAHGLSLKRFLAEGGLARLAEAVISAPLLARNDVRLELPIPDPGKILCMGFAYRRHCEELGREPPKHPSMFVRFPSSFVGPEDDVQRPFLSSQFDFEAELAVVIGTAGRHIPKHQAMAHVAGYMCAAENSVRDYQEHNRQVTPGKNFDRSGAMGPWLVTTDEIPDPAALELIGRLNGVEMQRSGLSDLVFTVAEQIAYVSSFATLEPGDIICTGTPAGVGALRRPPIFMVPGDVFEVEIPGVGHLRNVVIDEQPRVRERS